MQYITSHVKVLFIAWRPPYRFSQLFPRKFINECATKIRFWTFNYGIWQVAVIGISVRRTKTKLNDYMQTPRHQIMNYSSDSLSMLLKHTEFHMHDATHSLAICIGALQMYISVLQRAASPRRRNNAEIPLNIIKRKTCDVKSHAKSPPHYSCKCFIQVTFTLWANWMARQIGLIVIAAHLIQLALLISAHFN